MDSETRRQFEELLEAINVRCAQTSGQGEGYDRWHRRRRVLLLQLVRVRPLSVHELQNIGLDYADAVEVALATGGERTDTRAPCDAKSRQEW